MGRHGGYVPFQYRVGNERKGNFFCYDPSKRTTVDLGTTDAAEAKQRASALKTEYATSLTETKPDASITSRSVPTRQESSAYRFDDGPVVIETLPNGSSNVDPLAALTNWGGLAPVVEPEGTAPSQSAEPNSASKGTGGPLGGSESVPNTNVTAKKASGSGVRTKKGLSEEQIAKLASVAQKIATRANVAGLEAILRLTGRKVPDGSLDEEDVELLAIGMDMWLEELFAHQAPEPWMVVVAANILIAGKMLIASEPIEKKQVNGPPQ